MEAKKYKSYRLAFILLVTLLLTSFTFAQNPGTNDNGLPLTQPQLGSIVPFATETGFISLSVDGLGTLQSTGNIQVNKPLGATVRKAYLAAATTGWSHRILNNGDIKIDGVGVIWDIIPSTPSSISSYNSLADVTTMVKPKIDAAPAGVINFSITEVSTLGIDGEILAVIFDDPNQTTSNTVIFLFGAQNVLGDLFAIGLTDPINKSDPNLRLNFSLGISYGYKTSTYWVQYSNVDVNGVRLTSAAGGQDDGASANGALLTVGGFNDNITNPPNAFIHGDPTSPLYDDELYDLIPFVSDGDVSISVNTVNPSHDDNIFFASLFLASTTAIVGEGILLSPVSATNDVGMTHTLTAKVQDNNGNPVVGRQVDFNVVSGPHAGLSGTDITDGNGDAFFSYTGTTAGTDIIEASMTDSQGNLVTSNQATKIWLPVAIDLTPPTCTLVAVNPGPPLSIDVAMQDGESGLKSITVLQAVNAVYTPPTFMVGTTSPVVFHASKADNSLPGYIVFQVEDVAGNTTVCDPVYTKLFTGVPEDYQLKQNYPNPFNPTTTIEFGLASGPVEVALRVYDVSGREIKTLINEVMEAGNYKAEWDGTNQRGEAVAGGVYVYRLVAGDYVINRKMILLK